jgi:protein-disulfide isomerase
MEASTAIGDAFALPTSLPGTPPAPDPVPHLADLAAPARQRASVPPRHPRKISARDHVYGDPRALLQVVVYGDVTSPATAGAHLAVQDAIARHGGIRSTFRHRLTVGAEHPRGCAAAAEAVAALGLFWPFVNKILREGSDQEALRRHCRSLGLDDALVEAASGDGRITRRLEEDERLAHQAAAMADPTVFINGVRWLPSTRADLLDDLGRLAEVTRPLWDLARKPAPSPVGPLVENRASRLGRGGVTTVGALRSEQRRAH